MKIYFVYLVLSCPSLVVLAAALAAYCLGGYMNWQSFRAAVVTFTGFAAALAWFLIHVFFGSPFDTGGGPDRFPNQFMILTFYVVAVPFTLAFAALVLIAAISALVKRRKRKMRFDSHA